MPSHMVVLDSSRLSCACANWSPPSRDAAAVSCPQLFFVFGLFSKSPSKGVQAREPEGHSPLRTCIRALPIRWTPARRTPCIGRCLASRLSVHAVASPPAPSTLVAPAFFLQTLHATCLRVPEAVCDMKEAPNNAISTQTVGKHPSVASKSADQVLAALALAFSTSSWPQLKDSIPRPLYVGAAEGSARRELSSCQACRLALTHESSVS